MRKIVLTALIILSVHMMFAQKKVASKTTIKAPVSKEKLVR